MKAFYMDVPATNLLLEAISAFQQIGAKIRSIRASIFFFERSSCLYDSQGFV